MLLRVAASLLALGSVALIAGCASGQSLSERARAACVDEGHQPGPEMEACVADTEEALLRAREHTNEPPRPPPRPPQQRQRPPSR